MSTIYLVTNTANTKTVIVHPGTLNGPTGVVSDTDLNLHGVGATQWGGKLDENFIRLAENFACPESVSTPGTPMASAELTTVHGAPPGHGINNAVVGQSWFNTDSNELMIAYIPDPGQPETIGWKLSGGVSTGSVVPVGAPQEGDLWYDTNFWGPGKQLTVYNGTTWDSVADHYLPTTGGLMDGAIEFDKFAGVSDNNIRTISREGSTFRLQHSDPTAPTSKYGRIDLHDNTVQIRSADGTGTSTTFTFSPSGMAAGSRKIMNVASPTTNGDAANKLYVDSEIAAATAGGVSYLPLTGGSMTGDIVLSANKITSLGGPTASLDAANKQYVDDEILVAVANLSTSIGDDYLPVAGGNMDGDITFGDPAIGYGITKRAEAMMLRTNLTATGSKVDNNPGSSAIYANEGSVTLKVLSTNANGNTQHQIHYNEFGLNMANQHIQQVSLPVQHHQAANKQYVDDAITANTTAEKLLDYSTLTKTSESAIIPSAWHNISWGAASPSNSPHTGDAYWSASAPANVYPNVANGRVVKVGGYVSMYVTNVPANTYHIQVVVRLSLNGTPVRSNGQVLDQSTWITSTLSGIGSGKFIQGTLNPIPVEISAWDDYVSLSVIVLFKDSSFTVLPTGGFTTTSVVNTVQTHLTFSSI